MLQSYKCCSVYDQSGELLSAKGGRQPVLPSPGWGRWPRSGRMRSSPRPAYATCPPTSLPRAPGPGALGKESDTLFAAKGRAASPCCLHRGGDLERQEKRAMLSLQQKAGGSPCCLHRAGAWSAMKRGRCSVCSKRRAAARVAFPSGEGGGKAAG